MHRLNVLRGAIGRRLRWAAVAAVAVPLAALADTPLDSTNWLGPAGARYWTITSPGNYYLNVAGPTFATSAEYAIRVQVGNVAVDGRGKEITGTAPPTGTAPGTPNLYGVRVNGGTDIFNVQISNLRVSNKYFGVIFEAVSDGRIEGVTAIGNQHGLYFWRTHRTTVQYNVASGNLIAGILCDGYLVDSIGNAVIDNVADANGHSGIWMWNQCVNGTIRANASRDNGQMGIALSVGSNANAVSFNVVQGNSTGLWIESNGSTIGSNLVEDSANVGILLSGARSNTIDANTVRRSKNVGVWVENAASNVLRRNTFAGNVNWGIFHTGNSSGQTISDNYFSNTSNAGFGANGGNAWNVSLTAAANTVGGPYAAGNFWATPSGTGFSQTANDADRNGIADSAHALAAGNVDALPLSATARRFPNASFDADARGDLLWRRAATGENAIWFMNGATVSGQYIAAQVDSGWTIVGRESFDGDGKSDILWRHSDGRNALWLMDGASVKPSSGYIAPVSDANWKVVGVGDIDGDGFADIAWRHAVTGQLAIWYMRGLGVRWTTVLPPLGLNWQVAGIADFDGDGKAEILWRDSGTGQNAIWWFDSYRSLGSALIAPAPGSWSIVGVADFNGDGKADILWRDASGQNAVWFQNGTATTSSAIIPSATTDWTVGWVGDSNGDGKADIVWRRTDGTTAVWLMNGGSVLSSSFLANTAGWTLVR